MPSSTSVLVSTLVLCVDPLQRTLLALCAMVSVQRRPARTRHSGGVHLHAVEQCFERGLVDLDVPRALGHRIGEPEGAAVQPLVENTHATAVEEQHLERVSPAPVEDEQRATARLVADCRFLLYSVIRDEKVAQ